MENSKVRVLENFSLISKIMPYYGHTHKAFLVLSCLSKNTRQKLDEYYNEFCSIMQELCINLFIDHELINRLELPCDLFRFNLTLNNDVIQNFIEWTINILDGIGYYFNNHFMHTRIKIDDILLSSQLICEILYYYETLDSIKITNDLYFYKDKNEAPSILDKIILQSSSYLDKSDMIVLPILNKNKDINFVFQKFKCIDVLYSNKSYDILNDLQLLYIADIKIKLLHLITKSSDELELFLNLEYLTNRIEGLNIEIYDSFEFTDKILLLISEIKPKQVIINVLRIAHAFDFINILQKISGDIELRFINYNRINLELIFVNTLIKIYDSNNYRYIEAKCKKFKCGALNSNNSNKLMTFIKSNDTDETYLYLNLNYYVEFEEFDIVNYKEEFLSTNIISASDKFTEHHNILSVSLKDLLAVNFGQDYFTNEYNIEEQGNLIQFLSVSSKISCHLNLASIAMFEYWMSMFPVSCEYHLVGCIPSYLSITDDVMQSFISKISTCNLISISVHYLHFPMIVNSFVTQILSSPSVSRTLQLLSLTLYSYSDCVPIISMVNSFPNLHFLNLKYQKDEEDQRKIKIMMPIISHVKIEAF